MDPYLIEEARKAIREAVAPIAVETWLGPRSTEVGYRTAGGEEVTLSVRVKPRPLG